jgi:hypothetical protein
MIEMENWIFALGLSIVCFIGLHFVKRKDIVDEHSKSAKYNDVILFFFILIICFSLTYWLNIGEQGGAAAVDSKGGSIGMQGPISKLNERTIVNAINQDIDVGYSPF